MRLNKAKKVIIECIHDSYDVNDSTYSFEYNIVKCPRCKEELLDDSVDIDVEHYDNCPWCKQKLNWENYEKERKQNYA